MRTEISCAIHYTKDALQLSILVLLPANGKEFCKINNNGVPKLAIQYIMGMFLILYLLGDFTMKKQSTTIISIILLIIIAIFAVLNTATVQVNLLGAKVKMPLVLLIFVCLLIGALIIYLFSFSSHLKMTKELKELQESRVSREEVKKYQRKINALQKENHDLKAKLAAPQTTSTSNQPNNN